MALQELEKFEVEIREQTGKGAARKIRAAGKIPAICYGNGQDPVILALNPKELRELLEEHPLGRNAVLSLHTGETTFEPVMMKDYQRHPVRRNLMHVDFQVVDPEAEVTVQVPVKSEGRARGVRMGGRLTWIRRETVVRCLPENIPAKIVVDVSHLGPAETITAAALPYPEGVEPAFANDFGVVSVMMPRKEKEKPEEEGVEGAEAAKPAEGAAAKAEA